MALANVIEPETARLTLTDWLARRLPAARDLEITDLVVPKASGISNETVLLEATWLEGDVRQSRGLVVRVVPAGDAGVIPTSFGLATEVAVIRALHQHTAVRVPELLWHEEDPTVLGAPFVVMERLVGQVPADDPPFTVSGWVQELTDLERDRLQSAGLEALVRVHAADPGVLDDIPGLHRGVEDRLALYESFYEQVVGDERVPNIEAGFAWLREHRPAEPAEPRIVWGDARMGNIVFGADQSVAGVLDWEMVGLGAPEVDLGWWLFFDRHHTEGVGAPLPGGMRDRAGTIEHYEQLAGRPVDRAAVDFHEAFAAFRTSVMMVRAAQLMTQAGLLPAGAGMGANNVMLQLFSRFAGLPAPGGEGTHWIGRR